MAAFNKFNCFVQDVANKQHDMKTGTADIYKVYLTNAVPVASNTVFGSPAEIAAVNGYAAGGVSIGAVTGGLTGGTFKFSGAADPSWTAVGGNIGPFQYAVLYNSSNASKPLIGWWDYGAALTLTNGNTFTVDLDQTNGILTVT
ncbi:hypothetical protein [Bradyrhizobium sp. Ce-3]|uniref:hypothetical protein n=1 Tax=Bradyrhizobium sp. Ce-3 TaxID=2913970 RepID=UPI001FC8589F|nr:hypothetical protein [Bradyrhizobium sp. Ce-3]GKQ52869.1 hypothetical protein BRSPCE3_37240 [Bradyrhizobium sp. Ce-3]